MNTHIKSNINMTFNFDTNDENSDQNSKENIDCSVPNCLQRFYTLIDASGFIFRAFYAIKTNMLSTSGIPINAVYGYCSMLLKLLEERISNDIPDENEVIIAVFDAARYNFRNKIYEGYKANRKEIPSELIPQFSIIREITKSIGLPIIEMNMYEADDIIATYVNECKQSGDVCRIVSSDKDLMQLIDDDKNIFIYDTMKNQILHENDVFKKFCVLPKQVTDIQSLIGDSTDNIPGVSGIGPKTAADLISKFQTLENIYLNLNIIKNERIRNLLILNKDNAIISKQLATLKNDIDLPKKLQSFSPIKINFDSFIEFCKTLNFSSIIDRTLKLKNQLSIK